LHCPRYAEVAVPESPQKPLVPPRQNNEGMPSSETESKNRVAKVVPAEGNWGGPLFAQIRLQATDAHQSMTSEAPRRRQTSHATSRVGMLGGFCTRTHVGRCTPQKRTQSSWRIWATTLNGPNRANGSQAGFLLGGCRRICDILGLASTGGQHGSPAKPTSVTCTSSRRARESAWYCMRGLRPTS
jgi:hypothetical protein